jgi:CheY-like chemotaxis protein
MTDRPEFEKLVKDALTNIHNYAVLETHPLVSFFLPPRDQQTSRGEHLRHLLLQAINRLQPPERTPSTISIEWRPYLILKGRYVEGLTLPELKSQLSLSGRQLRREHGRGLRAVVTLLWDQVLPERIDSEEEEEAGPEGEWDSDLRAFEITQESLDLAEVVREIASIFQQRMQSEDVELRLELPEELPSVLADRIILRQIILSLFSYALHVQSGQIITAGAEAEEDQVSFWIQTQVDEEETSTSEGEETEDTSLESARYWCQRLGATFQDNFPANHEAGLAELVFSLPRIEQEVVLVVDDQKTAIRMFRRYLERANLKVVGVKEPEEVLPLARQLQPQVITLDVMMPTIDGWEILQALQTDPETQHIPVIVCSVWDEPELAYSLGAVDFLRKPISQKDLLEALARLNLKM